MTQVPWYQRVKDIWAEPVKGPFRLVSTTVFFPLLIGFSAIAIASWLSSNKSH